MNGRAYTHWTLPELRRISARRRSGEEWASIAQDYDVGEGALRSALQRNGLYYGERQAVSGEARQRLLQEAIRLRVARQTWPGIAAQIQWPWSHNALRIACTAHAAKNGDTVWRGRGQS